MDETTDRHSDGQSVRAPVGRSLVALAPARPAPAAPAPGANAAFLAQMIASRAGMGPFRRYRRAEPAQALDSYRARAESAPARRPAVRLA
jgi:hypothetical protein